ncbi:hypothetical protein EGW08_006577 [Elysia chlorotica]|uniref:Endonuclease n=1 Tax=Elysia chlorotica TaxID=188477 RepID=A0A433TVU5_ELYCH|nr:hypothetical protein EGW08_006577 [Elysia chlorotica]
MASIFFFLFFIYSGQSPTNKAYDEWKEFLESFFIINNLENDNKYHYILLSTGTRGRDLVQSAKLTARDKKDPSKVWTVFENFLVDKPNKWVERIELQSLSQTADEGIEAFMLRLRNKTSRCSFGDDNTRNDRMLEQLIKGCKYQTERKRLLEQGDKLNLDTALNILKSHESSTRHAAEYSTAASGSDLTIQGGELDAIRARGFEKQCNKCGLRHETRKCPAYGTICNNCKKPNHWAKVCRSDPSGRKEYEHSHDKRDHKQWDKKKRFQQRPTVHNLMATASQEELNIDTVATMEHIQGKYHKDEIFTRIPLEMPQKKNIINLKVKVDTGANANIITMRALTQIYPEKNIDKMLTRSNTVLSGYGGDTIEQRGCIQVKCKGHDLTFYAVDSNSPNIIGLNACRLLNLVKINCAIQAKSKSETSLNDLKHDFPECFDSIGTFEGKFHITLREDATPVIHPPRKCPIHIREELLQELTRMEEIGVIEPVSQPTDWVNSLAFSRKPNGKLRVCLDPKDLNQAIRREHHRTPTLEEISHKFSQAQVFSKLDAQHGYWAIQLDEDSSLLTTFNSPFGRYKFLRLPFGLSVSQDVFQRKMDVILEQCPGVVGITDDVCVYGKTQAEHDKNLLNLMEVAKKHGLVFNSKKCFIGQESITFFGLEWSKDGVRPSPSKCDNIKSKASPSNKTELQSFLGMIQYLSPFIPRLSEKTTALRELLKKDSVWDWTSSHENIYQKMKDDIHQHLQLSYFDPHKPTTLEVDSSLNGLGAALIQDGKPIAFASKSLTETEARYANIEREMLAVVFACERFHTYIYGKEVTVQSDHKPLETIQLKNIAKAPPRLQRMLLRIQPYQCTITYKPGKEMIFADFLSRNKPTSGEHIELESSIHTVSVSEDKLHEIRTETGKDPELGPLLEQIIHGWPEEVKKLRKNLRKYWSIRDHLTVEDGIILKTTAIMIPTTMQTEILKKIHEGHQGIQKSTLKARDCVFWLGMQKDITEYIQRCQQCAEYSKSQQKEPLHPHDIPSRPWEKIAADLFEIDGQQFLLVADYYSKMPFVKSMNRITSTECIKYFKSIFAVHGIPEHLITDNGRQFVSQEFIDFTSEWGITHNTSSPFYPQSNGFIERMVQTVKISLKKCKSSNTDPQLALLSLRCTPIDSHLPSPAEILFGRKIRGTLPTKFEDTNPKSVEIKQRLYERQQKQKHFYDKKTHELPPLTKNTKVTVQSTTTGTWSPATVIRQTSEPRSYIIQMENGQYLRRNRIHLRERRIDNPPRNNATTESLSHSEDECATNHDDTGNDAIEVPNEAGAAYRTKSGRQVNRPDFPDLSVEEMRFEAYQCKAQGSMEPYVSA